MTTLNALQESSNNNTDEPSPQFSDNQLVGGSAYTVRFAPNLSAEAQKTINTTFNGGCDEGYSVDELLSECLEPLGSLYGAFSEDDFTIINHIKEDYIVFS